MSRPDNKKNLQSEKEGFRYLRKVLKGFCLPTSDERKKLLQTLSLPEKYSRSFDVINLKVSSLSAVSKPGDVELIEIKVTKKLLPYFPEGFFFGMTKNEEDLLRKHPRLFRLCLVSLNRVKNRHILLDYRQLAKRIRVKRVQYQINL